MKNSLLLTRPIDGAGVLRTRRYARLIGFLTSVWAGRIARTMGLSEHEAERASHVGRVVAVRHASDLPERAWPTALHSSPAIDRIVAVAEAFVIMIDPLDGDQATPNAALRALYDEPDRYDRGAVVALAAQFRLGPTALPQPQKRAA